ncbi:MAG: TonB family protein [Candidatus Omnitrophica bacterium]|nr:TonB family protein [Candidatus Omnitrophota bacterium]
MFRDRIFNTAFLISVSWHIFCMLCFTIVVLPTSLPMSKITNVSFLGPILEKTAFELMLEKKSESERVFYGGPMSAGGVIVDHEEKAPGDISAMDYFFEGAGTETRIKTDDLFGQFKYRPPFRQATSGGPDEERPAAAREILYKPEAPVAAKQAGYAGESFAVELKFKIAPNGWVENVTLLASSGYTDVDLAAINYVKAFRFAPLDNRHEDEWDNIKLTLKAR